METGIDDVGVKIARLIAQREAIEEKIMRNRISYNKSKITRH